jgi:ribosomal protein L11 methyltransferase
MQWTEVSITVNHDVASLVSNILEDYGSNGVVIEDSNDLNHDFEDKFGEIYNLSKDAYPDAGVRLKAYFNEMKFTNDLKTNIINSIKSLESLNRDVFDYQENNIQEQDWENEWKNYFHPFRASERFTIVPSWEDYQKTDSDELCIELDPGMAFGTGDHPTTNMCLKGY